MPDTPTPAELAREVIAIADELESSASRTAVTVAHLAYTCLRKCAAFLTSETALPSADLTNEADAWTERQGYTKGTIRAASRKGYIAGYAAALSRLSQVERERDASDAVIFEDDAKKHADFPDNLPGGDTHDRAAAIERHKRSRQKAGQT